MRPIAADATGSFKNAIAYDRHQQSTPFSDIYIVSKPIRFLGLRLLAVAARQTAHQTNGFETACGLAWWLNTGCFSTGAVGYRGDHLFRPAGKSNTPKNGGPSALNRQNQPPT